MKREALFISLLLLSLLMLPIHPITAPKPNPDETAKVEFEGDITSLPMTLYVRRERKTVTVDSAYLPYVNLKFEGTLQGLWYDVNSGLDFVGDQEGKLGFRIDQESNNVFLVFNFGEYIEQDVKDGIIIDRYVGWLKYQLTGHGQWTGENIPYGSVSIINEEFNIQQIFYTPSGKGKGNSATGGSFEEVWSGVLSFDIVIDPSP